MAVMAPDVCHATVRWRLDDDHDGEVEKVSMSKARRCLYDDVDDDGGDGGTREHVV